MKKSSRLIVSGIVLGTGIGLVPQHALAAPSLRAQVSQKGDFALIGNTLGQECAVNTPAPVVGTVGLCGLNTTDSSPDLFWRADSPLDGGAEAQLLFTADQARSTAVLTLPAGAVPTHAYLYWAGTLLAPGEDPSVVLDAPGGFSGNVDAPDCYQSGNNYQCVSDITMLVQDAGPGAYRVGGVNAAPLANSNNNTQFASWWMAVFYTDPNGTLRNLALFDGLDPVNNGAPQNTNLTGFLVPNNGYTAKLGVIAFEGDQTILGDQFSFGGGGALTNAQNPVDNFFNSTRSNLGMPVSVAGDLPQLTGTPGSMSGIDLDVVDVTAKVMGGQKTVAIQGTSTGDVYYLAGFITSISDYRPNFATSTKTVTDINGGAAIPGDVMEYELIAINTGNDAAVGVVLTDVLPAGVTYVPGTLEITDGENVGVKTDAAADDQGDFAAGTVTFRLGMGADAVQGGKVAINGSSTVKFQVTIDADADGVVQNQGTINAGGENGASPTDTLTDGNGGMPGAPPAEFLIEDCGDDSMCPGSAPICDTSKDPNICVQCIDDADCGGLVPTCEGITNTCVCIPLGAELCDGLDNDCNTELDEGFGVGEACSVGVGECAAQGSQACVSLDAAECDAVPGLPVDEVCDGLDNNCDGTPDDGFDLGGACMSGVGECAAAGVAICDGQGGIGCDATPGLPQAEICDDALDSDCDGATDNGCACQTDADCGTGNSGQVCDALVCIPGCRGVGGNGCPDESLCTSEDETIGQCVPDGGTTGGESNSGEPTTSASASDSDNTPTESSASASASASATATASDSDTDSDGSSGNDTLELDDEGFGCECNGSNGSPAPWGLALLVLAGLRRRRRDA